MPGGPDEAIRTLASEEQLAFDLVGQLDDAHRARAMIAEAAPAEYRDVGTPQPPQTAPEGLPASEMTESEKKTLRALLETYAGHLAAPLAAEQLAEIDAQWFRSSLFRLGRGDHARQGPLLPHSRAFVSVGTGQHPVRSSRQSGQSHPFGLAQS